MLLVLLNDVLVVDVWLEPLALEVKVEVEALQIGDAELLLALLLDVLVDELVAQEVDVEVKCWV